VIEVIARVGRASELTGANRGRGIEEEKEKRLGETR
jgi:hypothetical protein